MWAVITQMMLFSLTSQCFGVYLHITGGQHQLHSFNLTLINPKISPFSTTDISILENSIFH